MVSAVGGKALLYVRAGPVPAAVGTWRRLDLVLFKAAGWPGRTTAKNRQGASPNQSFWLSVNRGTQNCLGRRQQCQSPVGTAGGSLAIRTSLASVLGCPRSTFLPLA